MTTAHLARGVTLLALFTLGQCSEPTSTRNQSTGSPPDLGAILPEAHAALHEAAAAGSLLHAAITRFLTSPDDPNRESAVTARHTAHDAWLSAWAPAALWAGNDIHYVAFRIDAWPITPGFLDTLPSIHSPASLRTYPCRSTLTVSKSSTVSPTRLRSRWDSTLSNCFWTAQCATTTELRNK